MGKHQKSKKFRHAKQNPLGFDVERQEEIENVSLGALSTTVNKLIESLGSPNAETKICACASIASFASETYSKLMEAGVIKIMGPFLIDSNSTLRSTALGALRNLSIVGGPDFCNEMVRQDVMTPLAILLEQFNDLVAATHVKRPKNELEVFEQAVHLLWNLCESNETAVKVFNKHKLCMVLLSAFNSGVCSTSLRVLIAQCLYTVADDNEEVMAILKQNTITASLLACLDTDRDNVECTLLKVNIIGILTTLAEGTEGYGSDIMRKMMCFLSNLLETNVTQQLLESLDLILQVKEINVPSIAMEAEDPQDAIANNGTSEECNDAEEEMQDNEAKAQDEKTENTNAKSRNMETEIEKKMEEVRKLVQAQQTALEIITNISCPQEENGEWEDLESSDTSADELTMETENADMETASLDEPFVSTELVIMLSNNIIDKVLERCKPVDSSAIQRLREQEETKPFVSSLKRLRCSALLCLSNLVAVLSSDVQGGKTDEEIGNILFNMWSQLGVILNSELTSTSPDGDTIEASSSALRAVIEQLVDYTPEKLQTVGETDLRFLCTSELTCDTAETRVNLLRVVACIGSALAESETPHPHLKGIGEFFCEVCRQEKELWVIAECLDCIFDVFGGDHLNDILRQIKLIDLLKTMGPQLKSKFQQQKGILGDHRAIVGTAKTNLTRFIKYKTKVMK